MENNKKKRLPSVEADCNLSPDARYVTRLARFHRFYWWLVACMGAVCALATVVAVVANVLVGLCAAIVAAVLYHNFKKQKLAGTLGLSGIACEGGLCIVSASASGEDTLFIPDRLMGMRVRALGDTAFDGKGNEALTVLCLPSGLAPLEKDIFSSLPSLSTIRFAGTHEEWARIAAACILDGVTVECDVPYPDKSILLALPNEVQEPEVDA